MTNQVHRNVVINHEFDRTAGHIGAGRQVLNRLLHDADIRDGDDPIGRVQNSVAPGDLVNKPPACRQCAPHPRLGSSFPGSK